MRKAALIGGGIIIVIAALGAYYYAFREAPQVETVAPQVGRVPPPGFREYHNDRYGISLFYPEALVVKEYPGEQDSMTIIFEEKDTRGFQIFIVPNNEAKVSEDRFRRDLPSGVRKDAHDVEIDGVVGAAFYSEHDVLGETAEVWLVHGSHLYEVTTLRSLDAWVTEILATWQFPH